jgi:hypothetical protein
MFCHERVFTNLIPRQIRAASVRSTRHPRALSCVAKVRRESGTSSLLVAIQCSYVCHRSWIVHQARGGIHNVNSTCTFWSQLFPLLSLRPGSTCDPALLPLLGHPYLLSLGRTDRSAGL